MNTARSAALLILGGIVAAPVAAQEAADTVRLEQIVVTATRTPLPLRAVPAAVTVIDAAELQARGARFLADALRDVAGIATAQTGSHGGLTSVFVRGGEPDYVQVLVDGVQINDPGGVISFGNLTTADVERIEIVRGPASVLYGSDAVAGVIHIMTRSGSDRTRFDAELSGGGGGKVGDQAAGRYGLLDWSTGLSGPVAGLRYGVTASGSTSDGLYAFNNRYDNRTFSGTLQYAGARADAALSARHVERTFHYPTDGAGAVVDPNKFSSGGMRTIGFDAGVRLGEGLELRGALGAHRSDDGENDPRDEPADGLSEYRSIVERRTADLRLNVQLPLGGVATVGAEHESQHGRSTLHSESSFGPFDSHSDDTRASTGWYAQLVATPLSLTTVTVGARIDDNDRFGTFETFRAGVARQLRSMRIHAAFGTGFKEPTFYENYATGFVRGDPTLQPEESRSFEIGAGLHRNAGRVEVTAFTQRFRNLIQYTAAPPSQDAPNYYNIGEAVARGVELSSSVRLHRRIGASAAYTWLHTEVTDAGFGEDPLFQAGERLIRRPAHQASITLDATLDARTRASLAGRYVANRDDLDFTDPVQWQGVRISQPAYTTLDIAVERQLASGAWDATAFLRVENLLDESYEPVFNFPAAGRLLRLGLRAGLTR